MDGICLGAGLGHGGSTRDHFEGIRLCWFEDINYEKDAHAELPHCERTLTADAKLSPPVSDEPLAT